MINRHVLRRVKKEDARRAVKHLAHRRLEIFFLVGALCFALGWWLHSDNFRKFAEFTLVPALEAFINREENL